MIVAEEWGRGFLKFGEYVRESSIANQPKAWVRTQLGQDEDRWTFDQCVERLNAPNLVMPDLELGLRAFAIFADSVMNPRWWSSDPTARKARWRHAIDGQDMEGRSILIEHELGFWLTWWDGERNHDHFHMPEDRPSLDRPAVVIDFKDVK